MKGEKKKGLKGIKRVIESIWHIVYPLKLFNTLISKDFK